MTSIAEPSSALPQADPAKTSVPAPDQAAAPAEHGPAAALPASPSAEPSPPAAALAVQERPEPTAAAAPASKAAATPAPEPAVTPPVVPLWKQPSFRWRAALAAGLVLAVGSGSAVGFALGTGRASQREAKLAADLGTLRSVHAMVQWKGTEPPSRAPEDLRKLAADLRAMRAQLDLIRSDRGTADEIRALDRKVAALRETVDRGRTEAAQAVAQLRTQIERSASEQTAALTQANGQIRQIADGPLARIGERLERVEKQAAPAQPVAAAPSHSGPVQGQAAAPAAADPATTASIARPAHKTLHGWAVRGVYNGMALLEGPGGMIEVSKGDALPELGRIESIERKGRSWSVVTSRGVVTSQPW